MQGWWAVGASLSGYCNAISAPQGPTGTVLRLNWLCLSIPRGDFWAQILQGVGRSKVSCLDSGGGLSLYTARSPTGWGTSSLYTQQLAWLPAQGAHKSILSTLFQPPSASGVHCFLEASIPVMSRVEHEIPCLADTINITSKTGKSGMVASTCHPKMWRQRFRVILS